MRFRYLTTVKNNDILKLFIFYYFIRCLLKHRVLHYHPERTSKIIVSCCILHNMCINANLPTPPQEPDDPLDIDFGIYDGYIPEHNPVVDPQLPAGRRVQQLIIRSFFTRH